MSWPQVDDGVNIVFSVGSFEQHGPHLPLATDSLISEAVSKAVSAKLGMALGPSIPVGVSPEHMSFAGTISWSASTFRQALSDTIESLRIHGFKNIYIINGHGGNNSALEGIDAHIINLTKLHKPYDHGGAVETSLMLYLYPDDVQKDKIQQHVFSWPGKNDWVDTKDFSESGVLGDPTEATASNGKIIFESLVQKCIDFIEKSNYSE